MRNDGGCVTRNRARLVTLTNAREDLALFFFCFPHLSPFLLTQTRPEQNSVPVPCTDALAAASQSVTHSGSGRQLILPAHRRRCDERHFARHVISSVLHASVPRERAATHFHTARPSAAQPRAPPHALSNSEIYIYLKKK